MYHTYTEIKGAFIERFNRTLKERIIKFMDYEATTKYLDELPNILNNYNHTKHSITKQKPYDIFFNNKLPNEYKEISPKEGKYNIGDYVRLSRTKRLFEKGYTHRYTKEVYKISEKHNNPYPVMYNIVDSLGEEIIGKFYDEELLKTQVPNYKVYEKTIKQKKEGNKILYQIKYQGYDEEKFFEWVTKTHLDYIKKRI